MVALEQSTKSLTALETKSRWLVLAESTNSISFWAFLRNTVTILMTYDVKRSRHSKWSFCDDATLSTLVGVAVSRDTRFVVTVPRGRSPHVPWHRYAFDGDHVAVSRESG